MSLEDGLKPEVSQVSAAKVRSLLVKAGLDKASYTGWVYANDGFKVSKRHVAKDEDKIIIEWMPRHIYGVISREDALRQGQRRQRALARYQEVLEAVGLQVQAVEYSEGGNKAYLLVG